MAQVNIPAEFAAQRSLLGNIIKKNTTLADESPLIAWLEEKEIDLTADSKAGDNAQKWEEQRIMYENSSVASNQLRDLQFKVVYAFLLAAAQVIKKWFKPNFATLLEWGIPVTATGRIDYPSSFEGRSDIAGKFFTKLASYDPGKSPLQAYIVANKIDIPGLMDLLSKSIANNVAGAGNAKLSENATEQRNLLWKIPLDHIHLIADFLKSVYPVNPRTLGEWGFTVDEGGTKPALRKSKLKLAELKTVTGVVIGSILTNNGKVAIIVYKGKGTEGEKAALQPGDKMGILKGYSTITVCNTSALEIAEYTLQIAK